MQNTLKTWDIRCDFSKKLGNLPFLYSKLTNLNTLVEGKLQKIGIFPQIITIFAKYLQSHMWFYKGIKVNISAIMKNLL